MRILSLFLLLTMLFCFNQEAAAQSPSSFKDDTIKTETETRLALWKSQMEEILQGVVLAKTFQANGIKSAEKRRKELDKILKWEEGQKINLESLLIPMRSQFRAQVEGEFLLINYLQQQVEKQNEISRLKQQLQR